MDSIQIVGDTNSASPIEIPQEGTTCTFQVVYPHELNLNRVVQLKRGRPRKKKDNLSLKLPITKESIRAVDNKSGSRTRSGRLVKLPKYIEKDFKKIEITTDNDEVQVSDFQHIQEKENTQLEFQELSQRKRKISAQFKCPKCLKAYLGRNKMIQHLIKYPDHGPLPENRHELNFDVWNYLFDITQKCKSGQRGLKFCQELGNLLHNVQLLKNALFKPVSDSKHCVNIDKVLGNAIDLTPGKYKFDETELYRDVTVLKLISNNDFFKPSYNKNYPSIEQNNVDVEINMHENKTKKIKCKTISSNNLEETEARFTDINLNSVESQTEVTEINDSIKKIQKSTIVPSEVFEDNIIENRNSIDELNHCDNSGSNLLDNSISSYDVMNVDQFVNERFKRILEPDVEMSHLDLSVDLFHFHNS